MRRLGSLVRRNATLLVCPRGSRPATIHEAIKQGITLLDTGDFYGMGHNEMLIGRALAGRAREDVFIQVKFGARRAPSGQWLGFDASPIAAKVSLAARARSR